jgi:hypothetical protein
LLQRKREYEIEKLKMGTKKGFIGRAEGFSSSAFGEGFAPPVRYLRSHSSWKARSLRITNDKKAKGFTVWIRNGASFFSLWPEKKSFFSLCIFLVLYTISLSWPSSSPISFNKRVD